MILGQIFAIFDLRVHLQTQECAEAFRSRNFGVFALADAGVAKTVISCDFCKGYIEQNRSNLEKTRFWSPSRAIARRRSFQNSAILEQKSGSRTILGQIFAIFELRVHWQTQECAEAFRSRNFGVFALADAGVAKTVIITNQHEVLYQTRGYFPTLDLFGR